MEKSIYLRLGRLIIPFWPVLLLSTFSAIVYVIFNSLSIWLTASLINNILTVWFDWPGVKKLFSHYEIFGFKKLNKPIEGRVITSAYIQLFYTLFQFY